MPMAAPRPCCKPGCPRLVRKGYCDEHGREDQQRRNSTRPANWNRLYGRRWRKLRALFLQRNPLCVFCQREGLVTPADEVDHIRQHRGDPALFWDESNWQPLCSTHHRRDKWRQERAGETGGGGGSIRS